MSLEHLLALAALAGLVAWALRRKPGKRPGDAPDKGWFPDDSTDFVRSTQLEPAPSTLETRIRTGRRAPARSWSPQVFEDIEWRRFETLRTQLAPVAKEHGMALVDADAMLALIARLPAGQQAALLAQAYEGEYWRPTCPSCGLKMVERDPLKGGEAAWDCAASPKCRATLPMREA